MENYESFDIKVFDAFIEKFAKKYLDLRSSFLHGSPEDLFKAAESIGSGFDLNQIKSLIHQNSVYVDSMRENGVTPPILKDIYRSDLGELLMTYYFEEKTDEGRRFIIPLKNISVRERYDMPGRGIDAIGYRLSADGHVSLLIGEAKVSGENKNPPSVVHQSEDSIYNTQKKYHDNKNIIIQRLTDYLRRLNPQSEAFIAIAVAIFSIKDDNAANLDITYGCGLVRDYSCNKVPIDYGKMLANKSDFDPGLVRFAIFSFKNATIEETVDLFYKKVQELKA